MGTVKGGAKHLVSHMEREKRQPWEKEMGIDEATEREKPSHESGLKILWEKVEAPWDKKMGRGKYWEEHWESHEESGMKILWGKAEAPWEKNMGRGKERDWE